jgi:molybdate-binding protein/DNA-binding XRE family transcriptional regulator
MVTSSENKVRSARLARGLTQIDLAHRAGISRQALGAIESGVYQPGVPVALVLARELGTTVESLFAGDDEHGFRSIDAGWSDREAKPAGGPPCRVALARVGGKVVAVPQPTVRLSLSPASGTLEGVRRKVASVSTLRSQDEIDTTLLIAGCDPAVVILADWLARQRSAVTAISFSCSSGKALAAVVDGRAHAAGVHLRDPRSGEYNLTSVRNALGRRRSLLINFARWELGLAVGPGNPLAIRGFADLQRPRLRIVNREAGSGARSALDEALKKLSLKSDRLDGYQRELPGHLEIAAAVASGAADAGVTIRVAADAFGLGFIAIREERYDLVVLESERGLPPVKAMLDALSSRRFAREVNQLCGYDTGQMGKVIAQIP